MSLSIISFQLISIHDSGWIRSTGFVQKVETEESRGILVSSCKESSDFDSIGDIFWVGIPVDVAGIARS